MTKNLDDLKAALFAARDGGVACDAINMLAKHANKSNDQAKEVLALYVREGRIKLLHCFRRSCPIQNFATGVSWDSSGLRGGALTRN